MTIAVKGLPKAKSLAGVSCEELPDDLGRVECRGAPGGVDGRDGRAVDVPGAVARAAVVGMLRSAVPWMAMTDVGAGSGQPPSWVAEPGPIAAKVVVWQAMS